MCTVRVPSSQIVEECFSKEPVPQSWVATASTPEKEQRTKAMVLLSTIFSCIMPSSWSPRISDDANGQNLKARSSEKPKRKATKSSRAPIVLSYFPVNSQLSRL
ncbi:hypothetical protein LOK49_LG02G01308 [Camellia lanceoleosa]|uniref:Uncharacterized protein n=1 Tax=Camellia lanceoleosa TaxID=1840588 RepID=A0ACC0ISJ7_9ERIC|nr:hypothetical protein LOK49_LG02G01308 [Camellia lanceoleosa]